MKQLPSPDEIEEIFSQCVREWNSGLTRTSLIQQFARVILYRFAGYSSVHSSECVDDILNKSVDDAAVNAFCVDMKARMKYAREVKGYSGWNDKSICSRGYLSDLLRSNVETGDPVDVANFCMMLHMRGETIAREST